MLCLPPPTLGLASLRVGIGLRGLPVRPPRGLPQPAQGPGREAALTRRHFKSHLHSHRVEGATNRDTLKNDGTFDGTFENKALKT